MPDDRAAPDGVEERLDRAEQLKLDGRHQESLAILEQLLLDDPGNVTALEEIADNELSLERYDRAETAARRALSLDVGSYTAYYILGYLRSHEGRWKEGLEHLRESNRLAPNNPEILRCLGWALFHMGQRTQGIVTLERALNLDRDNTFTLCDLGIAYLDSRNYRKARALFCRALDLEPDNVRAKQCVDTVDQLEQGVKKGAGRG